MSDTRNSHEKMSRRGFLHAMALGAGGAALAACVVPEGAMPAAEEAAAPPQENLPIIYWSMFGLQEAAQAQNQVERFNEQTGENAIFMSIGWGNVTQKAQVAIQGGNPPDMVSLWSQAYTWGPRGLLLPLEDYAERDGFDGEGWSKPAWEALWSDGPPLGHWPHAQRLRIAQQRHAHGRGRVQRRQPTGNVRRPGRDG